MDLTAEIYNVTARKLTYELPGMFAGLMSSALGADPDSLPPEIVINETDHKAQFYNITIKGLDHVVSAWTAHLVVKRCASNVSTGSSYGVFTLSDIETETDKNGLCRIVWKCSHCTGTDDNTDSHCVMCTCSPYPSRSQYWSLAV